MQYCFCISNKNQFLKHLWRGISILAHLRPMGVSFHAVVAFGLGKNLLFKSVLGHCVGWWTRLFNVSFNQGLLKLLVVLDLKHMGVAAGWVKPRSWQARNHARMMSSTYSQFSRKSICRTISLMQKKQVLTYPNSDFVISKTMI